MTKSIVTDFGADPTGASDSTANLNAALAYTASDVIWDAGNYKVSAPLTLSVSGVHRGVPAKTIITTTQATGDVMRVSGGPSYLSGLTWASLVPRTADAYLKLFDGGGGFTLEQYRMYAPYNGIHLAPGSALSVLNFNGGFMMEAPHAGSYVVADQGLAVKFDGLVVDGPGQAFAAFWLRNCGDIEIAHANLMHAGQCLYINPGAGQTVATVWAHDTFFDTSMFGIVIAAHDGGATLRNRFANCWIGNCWSGGVKLWCDGTSLIDGVQFIGPQLMANGGNSFETMGVGANIRDVELLGALVGNKDGNPAGNGIVLADGPVGFHAIGGYVGPRQGGMAYGIGMQFNGLLPRGVVRDIDLSGNTAATNVSSGGPGGASVYAPVL